MTCVACPPDCVEEEGEQGTKRGSGSVRSVRWADMAGLPSRPRSATKALAVGAVASPFVSYAHLLFPSDTPSLAPASLVPLTGTIMQSIPGAVLQQCRLDSGVDMTDTPSILLLEAPPDLHSDTQKNVASLLCGSLRTDAVFERLSSLMSLLFTSMVPDLS